MSTLIATTGAIALLALAALLLTCALYVRARIKLVDIQHSEYLKEIQRAQDDEDAMLGI